MWLSDLWRTDGSLGRGAYLFYGVVLFAVKYNLDRLVAAAFFQKPWSVFSYLSPAASGEVVGRPQSDARFYAAMVALALPFIGSGVALTLRRLRSAGLPSWLVAVFFVPVANLVLFALLCVLPGREEAREVPPRGGFLGRLIPESAPGSAAFAVGLLAPLGLGATLLAVEGLGNYGWGLFVGMPFALGLAAVLLYSFHRRRNFGECVLVAVLAVALVGVLLLILAVEGAICLMMAAPLAMVLGVLGGVVGYAIQSQAWSSLERQAALLVVLAASPLLMGAESRLAPEPPLIRVATAVEVEAPPEAVWRHVVAFSELPPPQEWLFRTGVAFPVRARLQGSGVGAVRYCEFSTGAFVEPIEVWDEPRRLAFSVRAQPAPMQEWTLGPAIHPPHLDRFLASERGQFLLEALPGGRTRLEGTTWYRHRIWPSPYWRVWSDAVIHSIHLRVLRHVKGLAEGPGEPGANRAGRAGP